jgi:hypothetical protein
MFAAALGGVTAIGSATGSMRWRRIRQRRDLAAWTTRPLRLRW